MLKIRPRSAIAVALAFLFTLSHAAQGFPAGVARRAPLDFRLRTTDGGEITSEMLRGDLVVLAFGASWLPLSKAQMQGVQELADEFGERQVRVYWVSTDSDSPKSKNYATDEQLRALARKNGLKVAVLRDPGGALLKQTGADQLPSVVILNRAGEISGTPVGGLDPNRKLIEVLSPRLKPLLEEK
jgi:peroxiredoxin